MKVMYQYTIQDEKFNEMEIEKIYTFLLEISLEFHKKDILFTYLLVADTSYIEQIIIIILNICK